MDKLMAMKVIGWSARICTVIKLRGILDHFFYPWSKLRLVWETW
jgi:hypothetical protein